MSLAQVYALVCLLWFITELVGTRVAGGIRAQGLDRASLGVIWITLLVSILAGSIVQKLGFGDWPQHKQALLMAATVLVVVGGTIRLTAILTLKKFFTVRVTILSAFLYRIRVEEHALQQRFGEEYAAYCRSTKRLVPWLY